MADSTFWHAWPHHCGDALGEAQLTRPRRIIVDFNMAGTFGVPGHTILAMEKLASGDAQVTMAFDLAMAGTPSCYA